MANDKTHMPLLITIKIIEAIREVELKETSEQVVQKRKER